MSNGIAAALVPDCRHCRHRSGVGFVDLSGPELEFMTGFKLGHAAAPSGAQLIRQGQRRRALFTLYSGLALRYRKLPRRGKQVLKLHLPGDLVGLELLHPGPSLATVVAVTDVTMCMFKPSRWAELMSVPSLAERISMVQAIEQRRTEARLCAVGAAGARANLCHFVADLYFGLRRRRLVSRLEFDLPVSTQLLADALGITPTHLRRTALRLMKDGVLALRRRHVSILNLDALARLAALPDDWGGDRPLV